MLCICSIATHAQNYFRQSGIQLLTQQEGLSNNTLTEIHQDEEGFLWLGTDVGLSRYDGIRFHNYNLIDREPYSIASIDETSDSLLWSQIANRDEITCFDKMKGRYRTVSSSLSKPILDIATLHKQLYAITAEGLIKLKFQTDTDTGNIILGADGAPQIKGNFLELYGYENRLCLLTQDNRILLYNPRNKTSEYLSCEQLGIENIHAIDNIHIYKDYLWICCHWAGVICYNINTKTFRKLNLTEKQSEFQNSYIRDILQVDNRSFIMATWTTLLKVDFDNQDYLQSTYRITNLVENNPYYVPIIRNKLTKIHFDKKNCVLWAGTFGGGLLKLNLKKNSIQRIRLNNEIKTINGITQDANGYIWLATDRDGIYRSNEQKFSPDLHFSRWEQGKRNSYSCIYKDNNGHLWLGDENGEISRIDPTTRETVYFHPKPHGTKQKGCAILKLFLSSRNNLWIATKTGLLIYDFQTQTCLANMIYTNATGKITAICEDADGTMWLGTEKGLNCARREGEHLILTAGYEAKIGMTPKKVLALYLNNYNQLFASYANNLMQIDGKEKKLVSTLILQKNLLNGHVSCMIDDQNGNTWLGTNSGIITINNKNNLSYTYAFPESFYDVCQLNNGNLLWVSSTGLFYFDPYVLKKNSSNRHLYISDIGVNYHKVNIGDELNGQIILNKPIHLTDHLSLNYKNNNLIVYVSDLMYNTSPNQIRYRLLPRDKEWNLSDNDQIRLANIEPGDYVLEISPLHPVEGNEQITRLAITVNQHWGTTGWAIAGYILIGIILFQLARNYANRKMLKHQIRKNEEVQLQEKLKEETGIRKEKEERIQIRNKIRDSLEHELRSPLSLITAPLKDMVSDPNLPKVFLPTTQIAYQSSIMLQNICQQLFDLHQQENDDLKLNIASYSARSIADEVIRSSFELLCSDSIKLHYDKDSEIAPEIWIDRQKIEFILRNILSNACRHISFAGSIWFTIDTSTINGENYCLFTIKDDGTQGIRETPGSTLLTTDPELSNHKRLHTELGFEIMKQTALAHQGSLTVKQEKSTGTEVTLFIPLGKEHFEKQEHVSFIEPETIEKEYPAVFSPTKAQVEPISNDQTDETSELSPRTPYKLLIIEDHIDCLLYLQTMFAPTYTVITAENGEKGLKLARKEMPDLIITDVVMPVMDGFECCRLLKEDAKTCHIPIIMLTALANDTNIVKGLELGADYYMLKPFNPEILRTKVKQLIKDIASLKQRYSKIAPALDGSGGLSDEESRAALTENPFIARMLLLVHDNLQNPDFNVKKLAEMLNMSQPTLYRKVKLLTNYTIIELIREVRLKYAAELLRARKYSVQEVSEMVGYNDTPTFRKHFVSFYGTTPSTFNQKEETEDKK